MQKRKRGKSRERKTEIPSPDGGGRRGIYFLPAGVSRRRKLHGRHRFHAPHGRSDGEWLAINAQYADPATVPEGKVQSTQFVCERVNDGRIVGMLQVRLALNDFLLHYGGHIGYSVRPDERRKGYASWMLAQGLDYCRSMGLRKVLITCLDTNEASRRTILHAGGVYESTEHEPNENENLERYWITLKGE